MKYLYLILLCTSNILAQISEDFSDGDFSQNPTWLGQQNNFEIDSLFRLHLNAPSENSSSFLCLKSQILENAEWEMYIKMEFNPSGSNFTDWYFMANDSSLESASQAYFVRIGDSEDEVSLYKKEGGEITKLIDGLDDRVDVNPVEVKLKVRRNTGAQFTLWVDVLDGNGWLLEGEVVNNSFTNPSYSGVLCTYTSTRSDKFYFDDFSIMGSTFIDSIAPKIVQTEILESNKIQLSFNQNDLSELLPSNFEILPDELLPTSILQNETAVILNFENTLPINESIELQVQSVSDTSGNIMTDTLINFYIQEHEQFDVLIHEIMIDPEPSVQLPNAEYIELYNRRNYPLNLNNWKLYIDDSEVLFDSIDLPAHSHLLLVDVTDSLLFENYTFHSLSIPSLPNTEAYIGLFDAANQVVHEIQYQKDWYKNPNKENGGWSLEMVDTENYCAGEKNWKTCENQFGGSPGLANSVQSENPDISPPILREVVLTNNDEILLKWSENLYDSTLYFFNSYQFTGNLIPTSINHFMNETQLQFFEELEVGTLYEIRLDSISDCSGNNSEIHAEFVRGIWPEEGMIVINEILFNPITYGYDYVELYNLSDDYIDLSKLLIGRYDLLLQDISNTEIIVEKNTNFPPYTYLVLCEDTAWLKNSYPYDSTLFYLQVEQLPSLPNEEGSVAISSLAYEIIDAITYHENSHFPLLESVDGVALERLNFESEDWFSAASTENYGTPGRKNSQFVYEQDAPSRLEITPEVFSPNNNGYKDFTQIILSIEQPAQISISIYNKRGLLVNELCNSELINKKSTWVWNGLNQDNSLAPIGIYMLLVELIYEDGKREILKHPTVISTN